jgi:hypothetical protein
MKTCSKCEKEKTLEEFYAGKTDTAWCKECKRAYARQHRKNNKKMKKNSDLLWRYGISLEDWKEMFEKQNGCCAICKTHQGELTHTLHTDHDHETGKVRGLLCSPCNTSLGGFRDDVSLLKNAIIYLQENTNELD